MKTPTTTPITTVWDYARSRKERLGDEATHFLAVVRDGRVIAELGGGLDVLLKVGGLAGSGYGAGALGIVIEGVMPLVPENPLTGRAWERGEAEAVWLNDEGARRGWVTEVAMAAIGARDGSSVEQAWGFTSTDAGIAWGDEPLDVQWSGIGAGLARALEHPAQDPARVPDPGDRLKGDPVNGPFYSPARGRRVLDVGLTLSLAHRHPELEVLLVVDTDALAAELAEDGLPSWHVRVAHED